MMLWTTGRVAATFVACAILAGLSGSAWQSNHDKAALSMAESRAYSVGFQAGMQQLNAATRQAFLDRSCEGLERVSDVRFEVL